MNRSKQHKFLVAVGVLTAAIGVVITLESPSEGQLEKRGVADHRTLSERDPAEHTGKMEEPSLHEGVPIRASVRAMTARDRPYSARFEAIKRAEFSTLNPTEVAYLKDYLTSVETSQRGEIELSLMSFIHQHWVEDPTRASDALSVTLIILASDQHDPIWREYVLQNADRNLIWHGTQAWAEQAHQALRTAIQGTLTELETGVAGTALMALYRSQRDSLLPVAPEDLLRIGQKMLDHPQSSLANRIAASQIVQLLAGQTVQTESEKTTHLSDRVAQHTRHPLFEKTFTLSN